MSQGTGAGRTGSLVLVLGHPWPRVPLTFAARDAGFSVHVVAPKKSPIAQLKWVHRLGTYSRLSPTRSVAKALNSAPFDLVVPTDDDAAAAIFEAYLRGHLNEQAAEGVRRSLGDPDSFPIRFARAAVADIGANAGVIGPPTWAVPDEGSLAAVLDAAGFPAVLKSDGSCAGLGVMIANDEAEARAAYRKLVRRRRRLAYLRWLLPAHDAFRPSRSLRFSQREVSVQAYVEGEQATLAAVAWQGEIIGSLGFRVISTQVLRGPAAEVEPIQHPDMELAAEVLARELGLSGLFGLDFVLSADGATASLLELNARLVPTSHLRLPWQPRPQMHLLADRLGLDSPPPPEDLPVSADVITLSPNARVAGPDRASV